MRGNLLIMMGLPALMAATAAPAQKADIDGDLRCIALISAAISQQAEPEKRSGLIAGAMYFIGRLDGKAPNIDLKTELKRVATGITREQATSEGQRCSTVLTEKGQMLQSVGTEARTQDRPRK